MAPTGQASKANEQQEKQQPTFKEQLDQDEQDDMLADVGFDGELGLGNGEEVEYNEEDNEAPVGRYAHRRRNGELEDGFDDELGF